MTSPADELSELQRWRLRAQYADVPWFEQLVRNEFRSEDEQHTWLAQRVSWIIRYAAANVPYYRTLFAKRGLSSDSVREPEDLAEVPILTKQDVIDRARELRSESPLPSDGPPKLHKSSGTTGRPVEVLISQRSYLMFHILWHRQARWFRFDPSSVLAKIRRAEQMPRQPGGSLNPNGRTCGRPRWQYAGTFFETGPEIGFNSTNSAEAQVAWLRDHRPGHLMSFPSILEEIGLAGGGRPTDSLHSTLGISTGATPSLRRRIEELYQAPFHQNYGLNEIGLVAARCEAGRYHVHTEHCMVEVVDGDGRPCRPGEVGRILVTCLDNDAMPMIRYDSDDMATAVAGPCPCGRTLPSFGSIAGRYRRYTSLPEGTRPRVDAIETAIHSMPLHLLTNLRRYQVYQYCDNTFELRLRLAASMPEEFAERVRLAWKQAASMPLPLTIVEMDEIPAGPGGKVQDFDSEFYYGTDGETDTTTRERAAEGGRK
jgi:phenylacetate-CoA ligase